MPPGTLDSSSRSGSVRRLRTSLAQRVVKLSLALALLVAAAFGPAAFADDASVVAHDKMDRTVQSGWGKATQGGEWSSVGGAMSVVDGTGRIASRAPGSTTRTVLQGVSEKDVQSRFQIQILELPVGGSIYVSQAVRVNDSGAYAARVRVKPDGKVLLAVMNLQSLSTGHAIAERRLPLNVQAGSRLEVALEVTGSGPVDLKAKAWSEGDAEPTEWFIEASEESHDRREQPGGIAFTMYTAAGAATTPSVGISRFSLAEVPAPSHEAPSNPDPADPAEKNPEPPAESEAEPTPTEPESTGSLPIGVRGAPGAKAPGSFSYSAPSDAIYVSPQGSDGAAGSLGSPLKTIAAALDAVRDGGTIVLREGVYHEEVLVPPQRRVTIQPAANEAVWLDGAKEVNGWKQSGDVWIRDDWDLRLDSSPTYTRGAPDNTQSGWQFVNPDYPMAAHPDQIWVDGIQLREVATRSQVTSGTFYVDDDGRRLVIGTNPIGKTVEASVLTQALSVRSAGSEIRGIGVRRYATSVPDMGTVVAAADEVKLSDVTIRDNSTTGFYSWSPRTTLERVSLINNGLLGGGAATADGLRLHQVLSMGNNAEQFNRVPVSGAFKVGRTRGVTVTDSAFVDNLGQGPWFDESVYDITFTGNDAIGNTGNGLVLELSEHATIADNIVAQNGINGIYVINSGNIRIWNNTVVEHDRNIYVTQDRRRASNPAAAGRDPRYPSSDSTVPWITRNTVISNNVVGSPSGSCVVCVEDFSREFTGAQMVSQSNGNLYHRTSSTSPRWFGVWSRGTVVNPEVTDTLEAFRASTTQERASRLVTGAPIVDERYRLRSTHASEASTIAQSVPSNVAASSHLQSGSRMLGAQPR